MDPELIKRLEQQEEKIEKIYQSVEKTRKYIFWTFVFNMVVFVLPLIGLVITIPWFLRVLTSTYDSIN